MYYDVLYAVVLRYLGQNAAILLGAAVAAFFVWYRFRKLEKQAAHRQEDTKMFFKCLRGCLEGLVQVGANGEVKDTLKDLNAYMDKKASGQPPGDR